jgi:hypothetical protein
MKEKNLPERNINDQFPWYDGYWLYSYVNAKKYISENYPDKLLHFIQSFEKLKTNLDFKTIELNQFFSNEMYQKIIGFVQEIKKEDFEKYEFLNFGRIIKHNLDFFNEIQSNIVDKVSELVGEEVEMSYNFLSLYNNLGILNPHMDAAPAKWTLDFCISQSEIWPIYLSKVLPWPENFKNTDNWINEIKLDSTNEFKEFHLKPNDAIIFSGSSQWHYRERISTIQSNNFCNLVFFHFIPKETKDLCYPKKWSKLFQIPELDDIVVDI